MTCEWPAPPTPPENRIQCSSCGYIAPKTEYYKVHGKSCRTSIVFISTIIGSIIFGFSIVILAKILT